jgi:von Willebrand factor type A domain
MRGALTLDLATVPVWAICLGGAILLLLMGKPRANLRVFVAVVLLQVGLFALFGRVLDHPQSRPLPPAPNGDKVLFFPIALAGPGDHVASSVGGDPLPSGDRFDVPLPDRTASAVPLPPAPLPLPPSAIGEGLPQPAVTLPGLDPGLLPAPPAPTAIGTHQAAGNAGLPAPVGPAVRGVNDAVSPLPGLVGGSDFFPAVTGGKIVFVIDRSGSMGSRERLERVKAEVQQIISQVPDGVEFAIIFFDDKGKEEWVGGGSAPSLLKKSKETVQTAIDKMKEVTARGGTEPLPALLLALQLDPDEVFFLTDGEFSFSEEDAKNLKDKNAKKARIHGTLIYEDALPDMNPVATIAKQHRGIFTSKKESP